MNEETTEPPSAADEATESHSLFGVTKTSANQLLNGAKLILKIPGDTCRPCEARELDKRMERAQADQAQKVDKANESARDGGGQVQGKNGQAGYD